MACRNDFVTPAPSAVSPRTAEQILEISHTKVYELLSKGELESFRIGRSRRITTRSIEAYIERQLALTASSGRHR